MNPLLQKAKDEVAATVRVGFNDEGHTSWNNFMDNRYYDVYFKARKFDEVAELYAKYSREDLQKKVDLFDKELDLVHLCLTDLCNIDHAYPIIKKCLDKIEKLKS